MRELKDRNCLLLSTYYVHRHHHHQNVFGGLHVCERSVRRCLRIVELSWHQSVTVRKWRTQYVLNQGRLQLHQRGRCPSTKSPFSTTPAWRRRHWSGFESSCAWCGRREWTHRHCPSRAFTVPRTFVIRPNVVANNLGTNAFIGQPKSFA